MIIELYNKNNKPIVTAESAILKTYQWLPLIWKSMKSTTYPRNTLSNILPIAPPIIRYKAIWDELSSNSLFLRSEIK